MNNFLKDIDFSKLLVTIIQYPLLIVVTMLIISYLANVFSKNKINYISISIKTIVFYFTILFSVFFSFIFIQFVFRNNIHKLQNSLKEEIIMDIFFVSIFFFSSVYLTLNSLVFVLTKILEVKINYISINKVFNPILYFAFVFFLILSNFVILDNQRAKQKNHKLEIQKLTPTRISSY